MVRGSSPASRALWKDSSRRSSWPETESWRSRDSGLTRMPMDEISKARPSRGFHSRMSPFSVQSS